jgi:hypothetical protein
VPGRRTYRFARQAPGQAPCTTCEWIVLHSQTSSSAGHEFAESPIRCNDRLFPSTSLPRAPGDTSFAARPLARGCCGSAPEHEHSTPTTSFHAEAVEPQMLLIDAGCEWENYASDITRTIPIGNGGKYTKEAGEIYELVLRMQEVRTAPFASDDHAVR